MGSKSKKNKKEAPDANTAAKVSGNRVFGSGNKVITDERFAASQKDPRFQDVPKHKNKVAIDSRFSRMFTDKNFSTSSARVDKRGRAKQDGDSSQNALKHYYRIDDEEKIQEKQPEESDDDEDIESDEENEKFKEEAEKLKKVREKLAKSKSESETESESGSESLGEEEEEEEEEEDFKDDWTSTDTDEDDEAYLEEENDALQLEENVPEIDKETHRLAVVNLDWNQVQAVDLFVVLSSFLPKSGQILSVSVYPSEFGLKRMEEEAVRGPVDLFDDEDGKNKKTDDNDESDDDSEIDNEKLRAYELSRLRYYFAVVVCDSIATADYLYKSCDGIEFERSSNRLDLRFIPDSMEFTHPARDVATEAPANYEGIDFQTRALQLSKIDLTWDENEPQRSKRLKRKINVDQESEYAESSTLKLIMVKGPREGETLQYPSGTVVKIGRVVRGNTIGIKDTGISSKHICIQFDNELCRWALSDLNSTNGTILNGQSLKPYVPAGLKDGDCIKIGELTSILVNIGVEATIRSERKPRRQGKSGTGAATAVIDERSGLGLDEDLGKNVVEAPVEKRNLRSRAKKAVDLKNEVESSSSKRTLRSSRKEEKVSFVPTLNQIPEDLNIDERKATDLIVPIESKKTQGGRKRKLPVQLHQDPDIVVPIDGRKTRRGRKALPVDPLENAQNSGLEENLNKIEESVRVDATEQPKSTQGAYEPLENVENSGLEGNLDTTNESAQDLVAEKLVLMQESGEGKEAIVDRSSLKGSSEVAHQVDVDKGKEVAEEVEYRQNGCEDMVKGIGTDTSQWLDLEKMTLGEFFDCLKVQLPKEIYEKSEKILSHLKENARKCHEFRLQRNENGEEFTHPARDVATETRALQLSKIDLTWDENEPQRSKKLKRKINVDQESEYVKDENELKEFIASSESETDEDENGVDGVAKPGKRQKTDAYRALLQSGDGSDEDEDDDGMDMEVTFNTGLEDLSKKILEKKDKKSETVWDAYLRKKKEKKKARKNRSKNSSDDESGGSDGEPIEEPGDFFTEESGPKKKVSGDRRNKETKKGLEGEEGAASRAELELLLADDDGGDANVKGYNLKRKKSKGKKGKQEAIDEGKIPTVDYDDPRFSSLFTRPDFALDPTDPQFKRSAAYARQVVQKQHKGEPNEKGREDTIEVEADKTDSKKDKHEMSLLLKSIKMKSKQMPLPSDGKKSRRKGK